MKKTLFFLLFAFSGYNFAQNVNIPDANFKQYLVSNSEINTNQDTEIQLSEAVAFTGTISCVNLSISDLTGIEAFTELTVLNCRDNQLTSLDVTQNTKLNTLLCDRNQLTSLDLSKNTLLQVLYCETNKLTNLDLSKNMVLRTLVCGFNQLTSLDVSQNTQLYAISCKYNQLTNLDVSKNTGLNQFLDCSRNKLTSLDVSKNTQLYSLNCSYNQLTSLDVSQNVKLNTLNCDYNRLTNLNVTQQTTELKTLTCFFNKLTSLDVRTNTKLTELICNNNELTNLDVSYNALLYKLYCHINRLTSLNVANGNNSNIPYYYFYASSNPNLACIQVDNVAYSNANWTNKDATASYSTNCALSTDNFELSKQFTVYPNPVNTILNIQNDEEIAVKNYTVLDVNGRVLMKPSQEIQNNQISLAGLTSGVYFIQLETDKGVAVKRIIKE